MKKSLRIIASVAIVCLFSLVVAFLSLDRAGGEMEFHAVILAVEGNMITAEVTYDGASFFSAKLPDRIIFDATDSGEKNLKVGDVIQGNYLEGTINGDTAAVVSIVVQSSLQD